MRHWKILWDFKMETDKLVWTRRPDLEIIIPPPQKKNLPSCRLWRLGGRQNKNERKRYDSSTRPPTSKSSSPFGPGRRTQKADDGDTNCRWHTWNAPQGLGEGTEKIEDQWKNRVLADYSIVEMGKNIQ